MSDSRRRDVLESLDLANATLEDLHSIQNAVLQRVAIEGTLNAAKLAAGHDSHGSSHSKNSVLADLGDRLAGINPIEGRATER